MSEMKFTPGPWSAESYLALGDFTIYGAAREEVAVVNANNGLDEPDWYPSRANAALIAAAPELWETEHKLCVEVAGTLEYYEEGLRQLMGNTNFNVLKLRYEEARAALLKAGQPQ